jgi:hypothetical protein
MPPQAAPDHPKYEDMVKAAILSLKDANGSPFPAIAEFLGSKFKLPGDFKKILKTKLKNLVDEGKLIEADSRFFLGRGLLCDTRKAAPKKKKGDDWVTNMREFWLSYRLNKKRLLTSLYALRSLPTELRQRVMEPVIDHEWRSFVEENKHRFQTATARRSDLKRELSELGCAPIRSDSKLCAGFVEGSLSTRADKRRWTAKRVARRMAEMKYVYEYCAAFQDEVDETRQKVDELAADEYDGSDDDEEYYAETDACESITGYCSFGSFVRGLAEDWTDFPDRWPWL